MNFHEHPGGNYTQKSNMIKARHIKFYDWFFKHYSRIMMKRNFADIVIKGNYQPNNKPILLIGNHFSWWDGFIAKYLADTVFYKRFHVMMLEEELKQRMFLSNAGAYSIMKSSKSMIESIQYTRELLQNKENLVTIFPQGKFYSIYHPNIEFEKGLLKQLLKNEPDFQFVFYVALVDYFEKPKPTLIIGLKDKVIASSDPKEIENEFNNFYKSLTSDQKQK